MDQDEDHDLDQGVAPDGCPKEGQVLVDPSSRINTGSIKDTGHTEEDLF